MPRHYFALDLHDDPDLIAEYERWHRAENIWPEIIESILEAGVHELEIFRAGNRLVLVMDVDPQFSAAAKDTADAANPRVQEWESLMWKFQRSLPFAKPGQKWVSMTSIFSLQQVLTERLRDM